MGCCLGRCDRGLHVKAAGGADGNHIDLGIGQQSIEIVIGRAAQFSRQFVGCVRKGVLAGDDLGPADVGSR